MKNNELVAIVLIVLIVTVGAYFIVNAIYQPKQSTNIPSSLVTVASLVTSTEIIPSATQTSIVVATQTPIITATKSPSVGSLITICSWQLDALAQMGYHGSPYPLMHTYIDKYDPRRDPNYQVNTQTKYSQYWMNPTSGSFDPTLVRSLLSLTNRDSNSHAYYVEVKFYDSNVKPLSDNNGYSWTNVQPTQTVVAEVVAPASAACYQISKVCTVSAPNATFDCSNYDVVSKAS
jgi:hypothetical protein